MLKFMFSTKIDEIFMVDLTLHNVKSTVKILSTFVAFLESMNFTKFAILRDYKHHRMICNALQPRQRVIKFDFNNLWLAGSFQLFAIRNSKECYIRRHQNKIFTKDIEKCNELCQKWTINSTRQKLKLSIAAVPVN